MRLFMSVRNMVRFIMKVFDFSEVVCWFMNCYGSYFLVGLYLFGGVFFWIVDVESSVEIEMFVFMEKVVKEF